MPKVKVGDITMRYEKIGQGDPLVFINGAGAHCEGLLPLISKYTEHFECILFDNRGIGQTDAPDIPYTTEMMANDLAGLLGVLGVNTVHLIGRSMGGMIAQQFAIRYPERVKRLVLMSTSCGGPMSDPIARIDMSDLDQVKTAIFTENFIRENPESVEHFVNMFSQGFGGVGIERQTEAVFSHDVFEQLPGITAPTLIITGDSDRSVPPRNSEVLASRIPDAKLVILPDAGHTLIEAGEQPDLLALEFLMG